MGLGTKIMASTRGKFDATMNAQFFANAGLEYMERKAFIFLDSALRIYTLRIRYELLTVNLGMAPKPATLQKLLE
jgi:hypothetical protein